MLRVGTLVCLVAAVAFVTAAPFEDVVAPQPYADGENYRLPTIISPSNYRIVLQPYLLETDGARRFTFDGEVWITIKASESTNKIVLHSKNLNYTVRECYLASAPTAITTLSDSVNSTVTDKHEFTLATNLAANVDYVLHFKYVGSMDDDMHGFYRSSYIDSSNNTKWIGSTQFQTNHARRAFPSFDEPRFKATFDVTLIRPSTMKSWSNTVQASNTTSGSWTTDVYKTTPKMSTYLLAFIIAEFQERNDTNFGVIARPEYYDQTEYSFNAGKKILAHLGDYLGLGYYTMQNVEKMHMAAIPDFSAGAMENWGLLTYRERALLYKSGSTILSAQQYIAAVVAHEQAHMWFGDLVTCEWWSYTWLNEGFARYFQYYGTAKVETQYKIDEQFVVDQIHSVMGMDATNATNPLSDEDTNSPADLSRMFNSISYNKGAAFIRMIRNAMGETQFQASLKDYLSTYQYTNTVPQNLLDKWLAHWTNEGKTHATAVFKSFTEQVGYPVVHVEVASDGNSFNVSQKRFLLNSDDGADASLLYTIPITYTTDIEKDFENTTPKFYLTPTNSPHNVTLNPNASWIILNIQETGYYRVNYNHKYWHRIHAALNKDDFSGIHELNRAQIVDDLLNLARASVIDYELALDVLEYLEREKHYLPWTAALNGFSYLAIRLGTETKDFAQYILDLTDLAYTSLGFDEKTGESALDTYNRVKILSWSCKYGNTDCISKSKDLFAKLDTTPVPVNIRSAVYCVAMREGNEADFDKLFNKYKAETVATEETLILNSLGCVKDQKLVEKYFHIIISDEVRRQDKSTALSYLYTENNENVTPMFNLVTENVDKLADALGGYSAVATVISNIASRFTEDSQLQSLKQFNSQTSTTTKFGSSLATLQKAETTVQTNLDWSSKKLGVFKNYLAGRNGGVTIKSAFTGITLTLFALIATYLH